MTADLVKLLRFQILDESNGAISGEPDAIRICGAAADEIEHLRDLLGRVLASGRLTGHALADEIRAVDVGAAMSADAKIVDHSMIIAAVDKYAGFLEENWENESVLNCAVLLRTLCIQHKIMGDEIERLRAKLKRIHSASLTWAMVCQCGCTECASLYEMIRSLDPAGLGVDVTSTQSTKGE